MDVLLVEQREIYLLVHLRGMSRDYQHALPYQNSYVDSTQVELHLMRDARIYAKLRRCERQAQQYAKIAGSSEYKSILKRGISPTATHQSRSPLMSERAEQKQEPLFTQELQQCIRKYRAYVAQLDDGDAIEGTIFLGALMREIQQIVSEMRNE